MEQNIRQENNAAYREKKKEKTSSEKKYNNLTGTELDFLLGTGSIESVSKKKCPVQEMVPEPEHAKKGSTKNSKKRENIGKDLAEQSIKKRPSVEKSPATETVSSKDKNKDKNAIPAPLKKSTENTSKQAEPFPINAEEPMDTSHKGSPVLSSTAAQTSSSNEEAFQSKRQVLDTIISNDSISLKVSPFIYHKDMAVVHTRSRDCSKAALHKMIQRGDFSKIHEDILKIVHSYTFLNAFLIRVRLAYLYKGEIMDATKFRSILRSMVKNGLLVQHECYYIDERGVKRGIPFFYSVSGGGLRHVKEQRAWSFSLFRKEEPFSIKHALQILAENQFDVMFERQYASGPVMAYTDFNGFIANETSLRLLYGLRLPHNAKLELFVFSIRDYEDWLRDYRNKLKEVQSFASFHGIDNFSVLVICENEWMAMAAQRSKDTDNDLNALDVFYTTDSALVNNHGVFDRLIEVTPRNNHFERNIFRWNL